jgi:hypothetical protein
MAGATGAVAKTFRVWKAHAASELLARNLRRVIMGVVIQFPSGAQVASKYSVMFAIRYAQAILIRPLANGFQNINEVHTRCKSFQLDLAVSVSLRY